VLERHVHIVVGRESILVLAEITRQMGILAPEPGWQVDEHHRHALLEIPSGSPPQSVIPVAMITHQNHNGLLKEIGLLEGL